MIPRAVGKGRGVWSTYAMQSPQHIEGGKGTTSKVVKFHLVPIHSRSEDEPLLA